jgi:hypothetical protein
LTLPIPNLDDRSFEDLMAEAISLIPRYNREWTDFNASDPGMTVLELLAWISESTLYSINKIPDESYWKFIDLVGLGRKERTEFVEELSTGDILVVDGEIGLISSIESSTALTLARSFDGDIERPEKAKYLKPELCPDQVLIDGKIVSGIKGDFLSTLQPGHLLVAEGVEVGVIKEVKESDSLEMFFPFSSKIKGAGKKIAALTTSVCRGTSRARGRHVMGEETRFTELVPGDVINLAGRIRVVNHIRSDLMLTVSAHFDEDIHDAVPFYAVRPDDLTGTLVCDGTGVTGNQEDEDLESATLRAVEYVSGRYRAVTTNDYEILIRAALKGRLGDMAYRVVCLNNRNFEWGGIGNERPGHITAILIVNYKNRYLEKREKLKIMQDHLPGIVDFLHPFFSSSIPEIGKDKLRFAIAEAIEDLVEAGMEKGFDHAVTRSSARALEQGIREAIKNAAVDTSEETITDIVEQANQAAADSVNKAILEVVLEFAKDELIEWVKAFMDKRRILTTRIHAVLPQFRKIRVDAALLGLKGSDKELTLKEAAEKLIDFIDPIKGGPDSAGWPFGRNLYRSEIYQILEGVQGVDHVIEVKIDGSDTTRFVELLEYELINLDYYLDIKEV